MINISTETVVSFRDAAELLPRRRRGRKPHVATFYRWAEKGLETIRIGGQLCTSVEALQRYFDGLSAKSTEPSTARPLQSQHLHLRQQRQLDQKLSALGL